MRRKHSWLGPIFGSRRWDHSAIFLLLTLTLIVIVFSGTLSFNACANSVPREKQVRTQVQRLDFLSAGQMRSLSSAIFKASQDGLLDYSSSVGTSTLLDALVNSQGSSGQKLEFIRLYQTSLSDNLPVFLITKASIRLLRRRAPFPTVLSTVRRQIHLLRRIKNYLQTEGVSLYLTYQHRYTLIDTLAESIEIYLRQQNGGSQASTGNELAQLNQIMQNLIRVSSLPVSVGSNSGLKGTSGSTETNPQLSRFLNNQSTVEALVKIAEEFNT